MIALPLDHVHSGLPVAAANAETTPPPDAAYTTWPAASTTGDAARSEPTLYAQSWAPDAAESAYTWRGEGAGHECTLA